jgi:predicted ATP-grasp superfamily ATP-dependent carboligase
MTTVLLTLGRLPKALDLARGFSRAGCRVIVAEPFGWTLTGASRHVSREFAVPAPNKGAAAYLAALADIVARERVDLVVPVSEETMHVAFLPDLLGGQVRVFTMSPDRLLALHNKAGFVRAATALGLAAPETHLLGTPEARALAATEAVVMKPVFSCSGRGVRILRQGAALPDPDPSISMIVQRFVAGREHSSCTIAHQGRVLSTMIYRGTVMSGTVAIAFERVEAPAIERWIETFVRESGWTGFISFDFIVDADDRVVGIECNPRTTSGLHFWKPEDVAHAVLSPQASPPVGVRRHSNLQQFYSCLTETQMAMFRGRGFRHRLGRLVGTRDVTWDWRDPWPFLSMTLTSWPIIRMAVAQGVSLGEAATHDIGWYHTTASAPDAQPS